MITTLPPIPTVGLTKNDVEDLMARTYNVMLAHYKIATQEVQMQYKLDQSRLAAKATSNGNNNGLIDKRPEPMVENFPVTTLKSPSVVLPATPVVRLNPHRSVPNSAISNQLV